MKMQFKIAAYFFLLTVLLGSLSLGSACKAEHEDCSTEACCDGLVCIEVSPGVFECEPEECASYVGEPCQPTLRECCDPLVCDCDIKECKECKLNYGEICDPEDTSKCCQRRAECNKSTFKCQCKATCKDDCECCVGALCTDLGECECIKKKGDTCDPNAPVHECCDLECVQMSPEVFQCQPV
ncbi:Fat-like cadherin-related tumor suppressor-like protein [Bienertia sinuspersici]